jgi:hypothetical protein
MQLGQELWVRCANTSGSQIDNGKIVYMSGVTAVDPARPKIELADISNANKRKVIGVTTQDFANGGQGWVTTFGLVRNLDTSHLTAGNYIYLDETTPGDLTDSPVNNFLRIGLCIREHPLEGTILIAIQQEDHNLLSNLQGGTTNQYYHLTENEHDYRPLVGTWEDLRVPASSVKTRAAVNEPTFAQLADDGAGSHGVYTYMFNQTVEQEVFFNAQLSHGYLEGSDLYPHVHWSPQSTNTGDVKWNFEYTIANVNGNFGNTTTITATDTASGTINDHQIAGLPTISGTGLTISNMLICRLSRDGSDATDTFTGDAALLEVDIHFQKDTRGSLQEYIK